MHAPSLSALITCHREKNLYMYTTCPAVLRSHGLDPAAPRLLWARRKLPASPCLFWEQPGNFCKYLINPRRVIFPLMQCTGFTHRFARPLQWAPQQQAAEKSRVLDTRDGSRLEHCRGITSTNPLYRWADQSKGTTKQRERDLLPLLMTLTPQGQCSPEGLPN